jgi:23S rRNA pseudouridine1911/1915/1917 synthase
MPLGAERLADPRDEPIGLHARSLTILHPIRYEPLTITAPLPGSWRSSSLPFD